MANPETVLSEDEASHGTDRSYASGSSTGTTNRDVGVLVPLATDMCGAIFTASRHGAREFACLGKASCSRPHHRHSPAKAPVGHYCATFKTGTKTIDGVCDTRLSPGSFEKKRRQEEADRIAAMAALGAAKSPRTPWEKVIYQEGLPAAQAPLQVHHVHASVADPNTPSGGTRASTARTSPSTAEAF